MSETQSASGIPDDLKVPTSDLTEIRHMVEGDVNEVLAAIELPMPDGEWQGRVAALLATLQRVPRNVRDEIAEIQPIIEMCRKAGLPEQVEAAAQVKTHSADALRELRKYFSEAERRAATCPENYRLRPRSQAEVDAEVNRLVTTWKSPCPKSWSANEEGLAYQIIRRLLKQPEISDAAKEEEDQAAILGSQLPFRKIWRLLRDRWPDLEIHEALTAVEQSIQQGCLITDPAKIQHQGATITFRHWFYLQDLDKPSVMLRIPKPVLADSASMPHSDPAMTAVNTAEADEQITCNRGRLEISFAGRAYPATDKQIDLVLKVVAARGDWVTGQSLRDYPDDRPDKALAALPDPIRGLFQSHTRNGYRLKLPSRQSP